MNNEVSTLWKSFLNGDRRSFEEIYKLHYQLLYEYGMRRSSNMAFVEDCLQDLFVHLWANRKNIGETDNIKYYLIASLKNRMLAVEKKEDRQKTDSVDDLEAFEMVFTEDAIPALSEKYSGKAKQLLEALNQLTGRQKEVIYLRYFEEMEYEQIAEIMGITVKGVYKLNYRALDVLKGILDIPKNELLLLLLFTLKMV